MRNTSFFSQALLAAGIATVIGLPAMAARAQQEAPANPPAAKKNAKGIKALLEDLKLTDVQKAKAEQILKDANKKRKALKDDTALTEDKKKDQMKAIQTASTEEIKGLLTPEQKKTLEEKMAAAKKGAKKGKGNTGSADPKGI